MNITKLLYNPKKYWMNVGKIPNSKSLDELALIIIDNLKHLEFHTVFEVGVGDNK